MNDQQLDPSAEVVHLRRLLDIQPGCLLRLGADGTVLAANDAALTLLGAGSLTEALGRDFTSWIPRDQHDQWKAFALGVGRGAPSSIECDVVLPSGDAFPTLFHGVPLADHPDGVASMVLSARVISVQRQLEAAIAELREELHERRRELQARDDALAAAEGARRAAEADRARALADARQLEMALDEFAHRQQQSEPGRLRLEAALQQAQQALAKSEQKEQELRAERDRLAGALREHAAALEALANGIGCGDPGSGEAAVGAPAEEQRA